MDRSGKVIALFVALAAAPTIAFAQGLATDSPSRDAFGPDENAPGTMLGGGGDLAFGVAYGNLEGVVGMVEVTQDGLFGSDEDLRFHLEGSQYRQSLALALTDEDFLEQPLQRTIRLSGFNVDPNEDAGHQYGYAGADLSMTFVREASGGVSRQLGFGVAQYTIDMTATMPVAVTAHAATYGAVTDVAYAFGGVDVNRVEPGWMPGRGWRATVNLEIGQASTTGYAKLTFGGEAFGRLATHTVVRGHAGVGLSAVAGGNDLPLFKTYQGGGIGSVRGFVAGTMGPVSTIPGSTEVAYPGGQSAWSAGIELVQALTAVDGLKALAFYDLGGVSGSARPFDDRRSSVGLGLSWESPIGPLSVFAAKPLDDKPTDRTETVQVAYGVRF
ncbi:BamA/TamA family outer membrane protein [Sagittula salina]|uniref:BamA/TamA family outer membrane protein n=1 Tax=Sagittula salina TaxID=2820268 RepID=A0A940MMV8_9RHOB|nr:BamA/TamA family outer membrane protein [Sagittula salina]MBP0484421.1 BamA/TamA family outer membrane protein [Sagittula salina]